MLSKPSGVSLTVLPKASCHVLLRKDVFEINFVPPGRMSAGVTRQDPNSDCELGPLKVEVVQKWYIYTVYTELQGKMITHWIFLIHVFFPSIFGGFPSLAPWQVYHPVVHPGGQPRHRHHLPNPCKNRRDGMEKHNLEERPGFLWGTSSLKSYLDDYIWYRTPFHSCLKLDSM